MSAANARNLKPAPDHVRHTAVTCPFCPLLCDDLVIDQHAGKLRLTTGACPQARRGFERATPDLQPRVAGKNGSLDEAVAAAADILRNSRQPLLAGLGTDVDGMRAAVQLAASCRGILDHMHGRAISNNLRVLQSRGWITTSLTEIRNRADLIVFVGTDASRFHRFYERVIWPDSTLFDPRPNQRELVYLGSGIKPRTAGAPKGIKQSHLKCPPEQLAELTGALNAILLQQPLNNKVAGIKPDELHKLAEKLKSAKYSVILWAPGELPEAHAEFAIESICNLVETINETSRGAGFMLGGADGGATAASVSAWLTGYPLRISFARNYPEYDPVAFDTATLLAEQSVDALLWLSTMNSDTKLPGRQRKLPTIVIADSEQCLDREPDVFIPAGIPGVDHAGTLVRADSVVSLPLQQVRDVGRARANDILHAITTRL